MLYVNIIENAFIISYQLYLEMIKSFSLLNEFFFAILNCFVMSLSFYSDPIIYSKLLHHSKQSNFVL